MHIRYGHVVAIYVYIFHCVLNVLDHRESVEQKQIKTNNVKLSS